MSLGSEWARPTAPAGGVGGGIEAWMKVFCTENPSAPSAPGVKTGRARGASSAGGACGCRPPR
eukprot:CAMPEP_0179039862 /NCGR_PEP_ID=MMETSP0796-20121207/15354_1 /TAXON_ID=73915 /ORGANISM="Pyrodinium bahamense, Strain pbaha01" /LENGTH=62 /DNA_ID=CAMNT_0020736197 /DNA_START=154 /DNA_END=338 /DNA_ORIENTATION=+